MLAGLVNVLPSSLRRFARPSAARFAALLLAGAVLLAAFPGCARKKRNPVAPADPGYGTLTVGSIPAGAAIRIDGRDMAASTPEDFTLTAGRHHIEVALGAHVFSPRDTELVIPGDGNVAFSFVEYAPRLTPSAPSHAFDPQTLGTTSAAWCLTVTNTGNAAADSGAFTVTGPDAAAFAIASGASWRDLAPDASQPLCVTFRPAHAGANSASIQVGDASVTLTASGSTLLCDLRPSETAHDFGPQSAGQSYPDWCFTITNDDAMTCTDTLRLAGSNADQFAITSGAAFALAPGASQPVCVAYRPSTTGSASATIVVGNTTVTLSGSTTGACAIGAPTTPDGTAFGENCTDGAAVAKRIVVPNSGTLPCTVTASAACARYTVTPASTLVPANGSATFQVEYRPAAAETTQCSVRLSDGTSEWNVLFTGRGASVPVADFGTAASSLLRTGVAVQFDPTYVTNGSPITSYLWDFGDNRTDTTPRPTHSYTAGGTYNVTLKLQNACGQSATVSHAICIEEPAFVDIWHIDPLSTPDVTTNIPGWGSALPLVLYRGPNAAYSPLGATVCANVSVGEKIRCGHDADGVAQGGAETLGIPGQSFATAALPIPGNVTSVKIVLTIAAPQWSGSPGPSVYTKSGACGTHSVLGTICCSTINCATRTAIMHCGQQGHDNRIEWGLEAQSVPQWMLVNGVRITWDGWWVCPGAGPQTHPMQAVNATP